MKVHRRKKKAIRCKSGSDCGIRGPGFIPDSRMMCSELCFQKLILIASACYQIARDIVQEESETVGSPNSSSLYVFPHLW